MAKGSKGSKGRRAADAGRGGSEDDGADDEVDMELDVPKFTLQTTKASKKRVRVEEPQNEEDHELEAEMAALKAMRAEKEVGSALAQSSGASVVYNKDGLLKCLADWETKDLPFLETMQIDAYELQVENEQDDLEREMSFYNHTLLAVADGRQRLTALGVPVTRPTDYFCEHVKSDAHMGRIKDRLLVEEKKMAAFEQRKLREENRKFSKQLSAKKKDDVSKEKKELGKEIKSLAKPAGRAGDEGEDREAKLQRILAAPKQSKKRSVMDKKYGFGGKDRKGAKRNDAKSTNDMRDFNPRGGKQVRNEFKGRNRTKAKKANRPGKDARTKSRSRRSA